MAGERKGQNLVPSQLFPLADVNKIGVGRGSRKKFTLILLLLFWNLNDVYSKCHLYECDGSTREVVAARKPFGDLAWSVSCQFSKLTLCDTFFLHDIINSPCNVV